MKRTFWLTVLFFACLSAPAAAQSDTLQISARGLGTTADASTKDALVNAMQQAVGTFIDSETLIKNDEVIKDKILSVSDGFVSSYDVTSGPVKRTDGLFEIYINATVQKGKVIEQLKEVRVMSGNVAGKDAAAEVTTKIANADQGQQLLEKHLGGLVDKLLVARLVDEDGKPSDKVRPITEIQPDRRINCQWNIEIYFDMKAFYTQAVPQLDKVFRVIAADTGSLLYSGKISKAFVTYATGYPVLAEHHWRGEVSMHTQEKKDEVILLSIGRDKFGENERFRWYAFNKNLYGKTLENLHEETASVKLFLYALDKNGGVVREEIIKLQTNHIGRNSNKGANNAFRVAFLTNISDSSFRKARILAPRFIGYTKYGAPPMSGGYTDTLLIPYTMTIEEDDLQRIAELRFRFAR
jgi:hypothetical protein